ncbi:hypothetical protein [Buttiauxella massiliensis]|uniref:hypothetical protein n=1 Tax=Buttiauxella massiliensis TaxID=2831590 RepID=UPI00125FFD6C|nr:hypothetical protein [Buttiauxella massiliensis]
MKKLTLITLAVSSLLLNMGLAQATVSSCKLKNGSAVAVDFHGIGVDYIHTNKAGTVDLRLPATAYGYFQGASGNSTTYYRFAKGDYSYVVISLDAKGDVWDGLTVYKGSKLISQQECQGYFDTPLAQPDPNNGVIKNETDSKEAETFSYTP